MAAWRVLAVSQEHGEVTESINLALAKTTKNEAMGALAGESPGSFLLRVVDTHYLCVVVCVGVVGMGVGCARAY